MLLLKILSIEWSWNGVLVVLLSTALLYGFYLEYWHPLAKYPGPFNASLSNIWRFMTFYGGKHHVIVQKLHENFGPVVRTGPESLSFSTLEAYDSIYGFHAPTEKGDWYRPTRDTESKHSTLFGIQTNEEHRAQRKKVVQAAFGSNKVAAYRPVFERHVEALLKDIEDAQATAKSALIDIAGLLHHFTFDTVYETSFGESPQFSTPEDRVQTSQAIQAANKGLVAGYLPWLGRLLSYKPIAAFIRRSKRNESGQLMGFSAIAKQSFSRVLEGRHAVLESSQHSILQNLWLAAEKDDKSWPDRVVTLEAFNSMFAGSGSISAALIAAFYQLAQPEGKEWQNRIRREHEEKSPASLNAVIKETLRAYPPFPTGIPRTMAATTTITIDHSMPPIVVPKGTEVSCNLYVLGRSEEIWGKDAEIWKPERWLSRSTSTSGTDDKSEQPALSLEERLVAFGKGPRACIGREIAMNVLMETITTVLQRYDVQSVKSLKGSNFFEMQYSEFVVELVRR